MNQNSTLLKLISIFHLYHMQLHVVLLCKIITIYKSDIIKYFVINELFCLHCGSPILLQLVFCPTDLKTSFCGPQIGQNLFKNKMLQTIMESYLLLLLVINKVLKAFICCFSRSLIYIKYCVSLNCITPFYLWPKQIHRILS